MNEQQVVPSELHVAIAKEFAYWQQAEGLRISPSLREVVPMFADDATLEDFRAALPHIHPHTIRVEWNRMKREWIDLGSPEWKGHA